MWILTQTRAELEVDWRPPVKRCQQVIVLERPVRVIRPNRSVVPQISSQGLDISIIFVESLNNLCPIALGSCVLVD